MKENIFQSRANQGEHDYIHDDTFQILDTNDYDVPTNDMKKTDAEHNEMMDTMNIFNEKLDDVECGIPDELTEDVIIEGLWENEEREKAENGSDHKKHDKHKKETDHKEDSEQGSEFITQKSVCSENI